MRTVHIRAFSLMEMTLVLLVLSIVSASGLTLWQDRDNRSKTAKTNQRMDAIEKALDDFRYFQHRLPCPADARLRGNESGFGREGQVSGQCNNGNPQSTAVIGEVAIGTIPTRALNLPDDYMYDAWGRRFTYRVDVRQTETGAMLRPQNPGECPGNIRIDDATETARTERGIYALISHGANGHGAYLSSGKRRNANSTNRHERANAGVNASFNTNYSKPLVMRRRVESDTASKRFDDILRYRERWGLVSAADIWLKRKTPDYFFVKISASSVDWGAPLFCAIDNLQQPWCWGLNGDRQMGTGETYAGMPVPTKVLLPAGLGGFIDISAGGEHACGIGTNGKAYCWGSDSYGRTGNIYQTSPAQPLPFPSGVTAYKSIYAGLRGTCAIDQDDKGWCWGQNKGNSTGSSASATITEVGGGHKWAMFSLAQKHSCGIILSGETYCWGNNSDYQLGDLTSASRTTPVQVLIPADGSGFKVIRAGYDSYTQFSYSCGLTGSGRVYCWGKSTSNFGNGAWWGPPNGWEGNSYGTPAYPATCVGATFPNYHHCNAAPIYTALDMKRNAGCALDGQGKAWCWGHYLGNGTNDKELSPTAVLMPEGVRFKKIAHGGQGVCGLGSDNRTYCWGIGNGWYDAGIGNGEMEAYAPARAHYPPECP